MPELHEESGKGLTNLTRELLGAATNKKIATDQHCTRNNVGHEERTLRGNSRRKSISSRIECPN